VNTGQADRSMIAGRPSPVRLLQIVSPVVFG